ncbi:MAG: hypothetical protein ACR2LC_08365 [Pyrinomonadaceae bacterium]
MIGSDMRKLFQKLFTLALLAGALAFVSAPSDAATTAACDDCSAGYTTCTQANSSAAGVAACRDALSACAASCTPTGDDASSRCASKAHACHATAEADYDVSREACAGDTYCIAASGEARAKSHTSCKATQDSCSASASY